MAHQLLNRTVGGLNFVFSKSSSELLPTQIAAEADGKGFQIERSYPGEVICEVGRYALKRDYRGKDEMSISFLIRLLSTLVMHDSQIGRIFIDVANPKDIEKYRFWGFERYQGAKPFRLPGLKTEQNVLFTSRERILMFLKERLREKFAYTSPDIILLPRASRDSVDLPPFLGAWTDHQERGVFLQFYRDESVVELRKISSFLPGDVASTPEMTFRAGVDWVTTVHKDRDENTLRIRRGRYSVEGGVLLLRIEDTYPGDSNIYSKEFVFTPDKEAGAIEYREAWNEPDQKVSNSEVLFYRASPEGY
jgi:hypothetical protein